MSKDVGRRNAAEVLYSAQAEMGMNSSGES